MMEVFPIVNQKKLWNMLKVNHKNTKTTVFQYLNIVFLILTFNYLNKRDFKNLQLK